MKSTPKIGIRKLIRRIYDVVHIAFWAVVAVWIGLIVVSIPKLSEARAIAEWQRVQEVSEENSFYCEKWGMRAQTYAHFLCTQDLQEVREKHAKRSGDELNLMF